MQDICYGKRPLTINEIIREAMAIREQFLSAREPYDLEEKHFVAYISTDFDNRASYDDYYLLLTLLPYPTLGVFVPYFNKTGLTHLFVSQDEDRRKELRLDLLPNRRKKGCPFQPVSHSP